MFRSVWTIPSATRPAKITGPTPGTPSAPKDLDSPMVVNGHCAD